MNRFKRFKRTAFQNITAKEHCINSDLRTEAPTNVLQTMRGLLDPERFIFPFLTREVPFLWAEPLLMNVQNWAQLLCVHNKESVLWAVLCSMKNISYGKNADREVERCGCNRKWSNFFDSHYILSFFGVICTYLCMIMTRERRIPNLYLNWLMSRAVRFSSFRSCLWNDFQSGIHVC